MSNETESKERLTTVNRTALLARDEPRRPAAHSESTLRVHLPTRARYSRCVHLPKRGVSEFKALAWSERRERVSSEWRECRDCRVERAAARADGVMARPEASESAARELRRQGRLSLQEREAPEQLCCVFCVGIVGDARDDDPSHAPIYSEIQQAASTNNGTRLTETGHSMIDSDTALETTHMWSSHKQRTAVRRLVFSSQ